MNESASWVRWLALPAALLMIALAALAIASESREEFISRVATEAESADEGQGQQGSQGQQSQRQGQAERGRGGQGGQGGTASATASADRLVLQTENGPVELSLDGREVRGRASDSGAPGEGSGSVLELRPDPSGAIVGFRVDENGSFVPVRRGESTDGMTLLVPQEDGSVLLIRPDGTEIELYYTDNGLEARVDEGDRFALRSEDGSVRVDDLVINPLPEGQIGDLEDFEQPPSLEDIPQLEDGTPVSSGWNTRTILILVALAVGLALAAWWFHAFTKKRQQSSAHESPPGMTRDADGWLEFDQFTTSLLAHDDPTAAIRLAFAYAEQGLGPLPGRFDEETPLEWLTRSSAAEERIAGLLTPLVNRYSDIRFGRHVASPAERDEAIVELRALVETMLARPTLSGAVG